MKSKLTEMMAHLSAGNKDAAAKALGEYLQAKTSSLLESSEGFWNRRSFRSFHQGSARQMAISPQGYIDSIKQRFEEERGQFLGAYHFKDMENETQRQELEFLSGDHRTYYTYQIWTEDDGKTTWYVENATDNRSRF